MLFRFAFVAFLVLQVAVANERTIRPVDDEKFYRMFDRKQCVEDATGVLKDYNEMVDKYVTDFEATILKDITPVIENFAKNPACLERFPELKNPPFFAKRVFNYCGLMRVDKLKELKTPLETCKYITVNSVMIYEAKQRNVEVFKKCNSKKVCEEAYGPVMTDC